LKEQAKNFKELKASPHRAHVSKVSSSVSKSKKKDLDTDEDSD
jgi:hypothetical protein